VGRINSGGWSATSAAVFLPPVTWIKRGKLKRVNPAASAQCRFGMLWYFLQPRELMGGKQETAPLPDETICSTAAWIFLSAGSLER
jgi:hypothetical protein